MRKLLVSEFVSLDGVMEAPEKWNLPFSDHDLEGYILRDLQGSGSLLYGRVTYDGMAAAWPTRTGAVAEYFNTLPKHVVSGKLKNPEWNNTTVIKSDIAEAIGEMKQESGKGILLWGSRSLVKTLSDLDLIDEYRLYIHPITLGRGKRLFGRKSARLDMTLHGAIPLPSGVIVASYTVNKRIKE